MEALKNWAEKYGVSADALADLADLLTVAAPDLSTASGDEHSVQNDIRAAAPLAGATLWRNNSGVAREPFRQCPRCGNSQAEENLGYGVAVCRKCGFQIHQSKTRFVRYGLGNDSKQLNEKFKSSDLIGITPVEISGRKIGVFTAIEVKAGRTDKKRLEAQENFLRHVRLMGGIAVFASSPDDYFKELENFTKNGY